MLEKHAEINNIFRTRLAEGDSGIKVAADAGALYIKDRLREESFARKILPPQSIGKADVQRRVEDDGFEKIIDIEPDSSAMAMNLRAERPAKYVYGRRFKVNFFKVESQKSEKNEHELLAYEMPITKVIEENSVFDIQRVEDEVFYRHATAAISGTERDATNAGVVPTRKDIANAKQLIFAKKIEPKVILMSNEMFTAVEGWDYQYVGDDMLTKISIEGWASPSLVNLKLQLTNKGDLVNNRELWLFASPEYLGKFYVLEDTKFAIEKKFDMISWKSWELVGMGFGNVNGIARVTFVG
jgi:hypothetical protein